MSNREPIVDGQEMVSSAVIPDLADAPPLPPPPASGARRLDDAAVEPGQVRELRDALSGWLSEHADA